jgi:hypothetical protein
MKRAIPVLALLLAIAAHAQTVTWYKFDPMAVRTNRTADVVLTLQTSGTLSGVRLDYRNGGSVTLNQSTPGVWTASVPAAKVLDGYTTANVNHNIVGVVRLLDSSGQTLSSLNTVIQVLDDNVPPASVRNLPSSARATTRILNLNRPGIDINGVQAAVQQLYGYFHDDYDFVEVVYTEPSYPQNRYHFQVRNDVTGIGAPFLNNAAQYGSAGKLLGITVFPIDDFFDTAETAFSHELGHQWILYLKNASLAPGPHWPPSTMARGIMGFNIPGSSVGGDFPYTITPVTASTARLNVSTVTKEFSDFDLYLMGFIPASGVAPGIVVQGSACDNCVLPSSTITINDVIAVNGVRSPDWVSSKKFFRVATVVVSRDRLLTDDEMTILEYFAARGESDVPLPYTSGLDRGTTKPFNVATRGIGHVDFRLEIPPRRRDVRH